MNENSEAVLFMHTAIIDTVVEKMMIFEAVKEDLELVEDDLKKKNIKKDGDMTKCQIKCQGFNEDRTQCSRICWIEEQEEHFLLDEEPMYCARHKHLLDTEKQEKTSWLFTRPFSWKFIQQKICLAILCFSMALCLLFLGISFQNMTACIMSLLFTCCSIACILLIFWHVYTNIEHSTNSVSYSMSRRKDLQPVLIASGA